MTALKQIASIDKDALHNIARQACERIAPSWPLDQMIAVNPLWERRDQLWATVAEQLWRRAGSRLTLTAADYRQAWQDGRIAEIRDYCETDVVNTYLVYLRFERMRGHLDASAWAAEVQVVRDALAHIDAPHWKQFLAAWPQV